MCDCYRHKCEECEALLPWHIGDFKYPREYFKMWCPAHEAVAPKSAVRFNISDSFVEASGIWAVTGPSWKDNHPNCGYTEVTDDRRSLYDNGAR